MARQLTLSAVLPGPAREAAAPPGGTLARQGRTGLRRSLQRLGLHLGAAAYRPERHYMRGGRTPGCRSMAGG